MEDHPKCSALRMKLKLWKCRRVGSGTLALGRIWIHGGGTILLGNRVLLDGRTAPIELHVTRGATLDIGDGVVVRGGSSIEATDFVKLGNGCRLGPFVKVIDNQFHPLRGDRHRWPAALHVLVEDDVVIGEHAIVLPGAYIQAGVHIGPRSVVSRRIPRGVAIAGNPPRCVDSEAPCAESAP